MWGGGGTEETAGKEMFGMTILAGRAAPMAVKVMRMERGFVREGSEAEVTKSMKVGMMMVIPIVTQRGVAPEIRTSGSRERMEWRGKVKGGGIMEMALAM